MLAWEIAGLANSSTMDLGMVHSTNRQWSYAGSVIVPLDGRWSAFWTGEGIIRAVVSHRGRRQSAQVESEVDGPLPGIVTGLLAAAGGRP